MQEDAQKMIDTYNLLAVELVQRNQFKESVLTDEIMEIEKCSKSQALKFQRGHCNALSFWAVIFAQRDYNGTYEEFYKFLRDNKFRNGKPFMDPGGWVYIKKNELLSRLGIEKQEYKYTVPPVDRQPGDVYRLSINGGHHFIAGCVVQNGDIHIFDTNDRGCPIEMNEGFKKKGDKLDWVKVIR
jgi:hypothetical protein